MFELNVLSIVKSVGHILKISKA